MTQEQGSFSDPLDFVRNMWGNMGFSLPGMVAPTFDEEELDKRIKDLKTVEGWLRMNLSMLQMTIQGLEMQKTTLGAVRAVGSMASSAMNAGSASPEAAAAPSGGDDAQALWPWTMMRQMQEHLQNQAEAMSKSVPEAPTAKQAPRSRSRKS